MNFLLDTIIVGSNYRIFRCYLPLRMPDDIPVDYPVLQQVLLAHTINRTIFDKVDRLDSIYKIIDLSNQTIVYDRTSISETQSYMLTTSEVEKYNSIVVSSIEYVVQQLNH